MAGRPANPPEIEFAGEAIRLDGQVVREATRRARAARLPDNNARTAVPEAHRRRTRRPLRRARPRELADRLEADVSRRARSGKRGHRGRPRNDAGDPGQHRRRRAAEHRRPSPASCGRPRRAGPSLDDLWPGLTPQRLLDDLFADPERLASRGARPDSGRACRLAARRPAAGASPTCRCSTRQPSCWARTSGPPRRGSAREHAQRVAYAQGVLDIAADRPAARRRSA